MRCVPCLGRFWGMRTRADGDAVSIVVHKDGDQKPGGGFYECAADLGRDISDRDRMWIVELKRVYAECTKAK